MSFPEFTIVQAIYRFASDNCTNESSRYHFFERWRDAGDNERLRYVEETVRVEALMFKHLTQVTEKRNA